MNKYNIKQWVLFFVSSFFTIANAQLVNYTEPDRTDLRDMSFEVIGRLNGNIHIYKGQRDVHNINIYDAQMKPVSKVDIDYFSSKVLNVEFINYSNFYYMFYQLQKRNVLYCMAAKIDANGKTIGEPLALDTTEIGFTASEKIYTVINSEDKQHIMLIKIRKPSEKESIVTSVLFTNELKKADKTFLNIKTQERFSALTEFTVTNTGKLIFIKAYSTGQNENVNKLAIVTKELDMIEPSVSDINLGSIFLDDIKLKFDNVNKRINLTSFFTKTRRGNTDGLFLLSLNENDKTISYNVKHTFSDEFRVEARPEGTSPKMALNDFYLRNIILKNDGGLVLFAENYSANSRNNDFNRWDGFGSPWGWGGMGGGFNNWGWNNGFASPFGMNSMWGATGNRWGNVTRFYSENIITLSVATDGKLEWTNIIRKSQFDDNTDNHLGFGIYKTNDEIHFFFNNQEKRQTVLSDQSINLEGQIKRMPTYKNMEKGYEFMPKYLKQTGSKQIVVPCLLRGYLCFAKIDY